MLKTIFFMLILSLAACKTIPAANSKPVECLSDKTHYIYLIHGLYGVKEHFGHMKELLPLHLNSNLTNDGKDKLCIEVHNFKYPILDKNLGVSNFSDSFTSQLNDDINNK